MNLFEKVFNHQIISRLENSGSLMITSHERAWLKIMLEHPAAAHAFTGQTLHKLHEALKMEERLDIDEHLLQKAGSVEKQLYHPWLRDLRKLISSKSGISITYETKGDRLHREHSGFPYKLEYSMVKREWYLLWYRLGNHALMSTKLSKIHAVTPKPLAPTTVASILQSIEHRLAVRKHEAVIEIVSLYNAELSRILYALSSFEKEVQYDAEHDTYVVKLVVISSEADYLLSKLRFLGKRVRVVQGNYLKKRMLESTTKALARYEATEAANAAETDEAAAIKATAAAETATSIDATTAAETVATIGEATAAAEAAITIDATAAAETAITIDATAAEAAAGNAVCAEANVDVDDNRQ